MTQPSQHNTTRAIGFMMAGVFLFSLNDAMGKWLVGTYSVGQVLFIRSAAAIAVLLPMAWMEDRCVGLFRLQKPWWHFARALLAVVEIYAFYYVLKYMPLADTMAYWLAAPIYVAAMTSFAGEKSSHMQRALIVLGFLGVLVVLRPSSAIFEGPALMALLGGFSYAVFLLITRKIAGGSGTTLVFWQIVATMILGAVLAPAEWKTPTMVDFSGLALLGLVAMSAHLLMARSFKLAPANVVVPYQYTMIVWAIVLGWLMFGDVPDMITLVGVGIIVAVGFGLFLHDKRASAAADQAGEH